MTATTTDRNTPALLSWRQNQTPLETGSVIPAGVMVAVNASAGKAVNAANTAGLRVRGRSEHAASQTAGDVDIVTARGVFGFAMSSALLAVAQAQVGKRVYVVDNQTVGLASDASARVVAGKLEEVDGSTAFVSVGLETDSSETGEGVGTLADSAVSPAVTIAGIPVTVAILLPDAATADYDYITQDKIEIIDVTVIKDAAGAANTLQVKNGSGTAISDAIAAAVDKAVTRSGTLDKATRVIAAGGTIRLTNTRAAGSSALACFIRAIKRA